MTTEPATDLTVWSVTDYDDEIFHGTFLDRVKAAMLIGKIQDALREQAHQCGEDCGVRACGPCSFDRVKAYDEQQRAAARDGEA